MRGQTFLVNLQSKQILGGEKKYSETKCSGERKKDVYLYVVKEKKYEQREEVREREERKVKSEAVS